MRSIVVLLVSMWLFCGCASIPTSSKVTDSKVDVDVVKKALCVGMEFSDLAGDCPGAGVDAEVAELLFTENGFEVTLLRDQECTRATALATLQEIISGAEPGSLLAVYWSGHGGQTYDLNGDESDGMDEYLCPWDVPLLDDDLANLADKIPAGVRVFVIFDTCNSGTMARKALCTPKVVNVPSFKASMLVFAGCADGKLSFGSAQGGVWTTALIDSWDDSITYQEWFERAVSKMDTDVQLPKWTEYGKSSWSELKVLH